MWVWPHTTVRCEAGSSANTSAHCSRPVSTSTTSSSRRGVPWQNTVGPKVVEFQHHRMGQLGEQAHVRLAQLFGGPPADFVGNLDALAACQRLSSRSALPRPKRPGHRVPATRRAQRLKRPSDHRRGARRCGQPTNPTAHTETIHRSVQCHAQRCTSRSATGDGQVTW